MDLNKSFRLQIPENLTQLTAKYWLSTANSQVTNGHKDKKEHKDAQVTD